jgi:hypothetical protein
MSALRGRASICLPSSCLAPDTQSLSPVTQWRMSMTRRSFNLSLSPADRITVANWRRRVAALYASIILLTLVGVLVAYYRGEGAENQIANSRPLQMNSKISRGLEATGPNACDCAAQAFRWHWRRRSLGDLPALAPQTGCSRSDAALPAI